MTALLVANPINDPQQIAVAFGRLLRGVGLQVPVSRVMSFVEALGLLGLQSRQDVYWAGRSTLVSDPQDLVAFDRAFAVFWEGKSSSGIVVELPPISVTLATDTAEDEGDHSEPVETPAGPTLRVR